jgi:hypothetical protein
MAALQIELILCLLPDETEIRPQCRFGDRLSFIGVALLPIREGPHIDGWDDPYFVLGRRQHAADEMGAEASLHCADARRQFSEYVG